MKKLFAVLALGALVSLSLMGCNNESEAVTTPVSAGAAPVASGDTSGKEKMTPSAAPAPEVNPNYSGGIGSKAK
jgi:uncharacterized lipoprotein NlpE involved in copper resistance